MRSKGSLQQITRINTCGMGNAPAIFYDRRELFCPRILSFRSGSRWVRLIFLGSPQGLPEKRRTRISMGFATGKAHKRETQGKYFYLDFKKEFYQDLALFAKAHQAVQVPSAADLFDVLSEARAKQGRICLPIFSARIFSMDFKILASLVISNCLEGNTMRNRGAYSTKERMPSDIEPPSTNQPGRLYLIGGVLPSRQ